MTLHSVGLRAGGTKELHREHGGAEGTEKRGKGLESSPEEQQGGLFQSFGDPSQEAGCVGPINKSMIVR